MKIETILKRLSADKLNSEQALEALARIGYCPCLFNDDNGHWAISFDGFQSVPAGDAPDDISTYCWIEKKWWKDSIKEALIYSLENDD
jgi:hypothetical protein